MVLHDFQGPFKDPLINSAVAPFISNLSFKVERQLLLVDKIIFFLALRETRAINDALI